VSAKGKVFWRAVTGAAGAVAGDRIGDLEVPFAVRRQSDRLLGQDALTGRCAHRQAGIDGGIAVIAAALRLGMSGFGRCGRLGRHHAILDERQAHPNRQRQGQEQDSDPLSGRGFHDGHSMTPRNAGSKLPEPERARNLRPSTAAAVVLDELGARGRCGIQAREG
jgi:hypothetical protein